MPKIGRFCQNWLKLAGLTNRQIAATTTSKITSDTRLDNKLKNCRDRNPERCRLAVYMPGRIEVDEAEGLATERVVAVEVRGLPASLREDLLD